MHNSTLEQIQISQPRSRVVEILEKEQFELKEIFTLFIKLTNKEALTVLCSVVKHAGSDKSTKEV